VTLKEIRNNGRYPVFVVEPARGPFHLGTLGGLNFHPCASFSFLCRRFRGDLVPPAIWHRPLPGSPISPTVAPISPPPASILAATVLFGARTAQILAADVIGGNFWLHLFEI
jgi:hypothetical protein